MLLVLARNSPFLKLMGQLVTDFLMQPETRNLLMSAGGTRELDILALEENEHLRQLWVDTCEKQQQGADRLLANDGDSVMIAVETAIVGVADCLDAIAGVRPYRKAYTFHEAIGIMDEESHLYHPDVFAAARELVMSEELEGREFSP